MLRSVVKPDCCGLRFVSSRGLIHIRSTCVKTFPDTDNSTNGLMNVKKRFRRHRQHEGTASPEGEGLLWALCKGRIAGQMMVSTANVARESLPVCAVCPHQAPVARNGRPLQLGFAPDAVLPMQFSFFDFLLRFTMNLALIGFDFVSMFT